MSDNIQPNVVSCWPMSDHPLYTIGYGARGIDELVAVLKHYQIAYLIDIRSQPYSRFKPEYRREPLEQRLKREGIRYIFMGDTLGGRPSDPACYKSDGKVDYEAYSLQPDYLRGIDRLRQAWTQQLSVALMCSEGKPENCHRSKLVGVSLNEIGISVVHIDENDQPLSQEEIWGKIIGGQPSLFGPDFHQLTSRKRYEVDDTDQDGYS